MRDPRQRESRPAGNGTANLENAGQAVPTVPACPETRPADPPVATFTPEDAVNVAGGALVVATHTYGDRHVRRVHLTLAAAQRAVERAEDRGHQAHIVLSRIVPVGVVS